jgi:hypothetical protein
MTDAPANILVIEAIQTTLPARIGVFASPSA